MLINTVDYLVKQLRNKDVKVRCEAANALGNKAGKIILDEAIKSKVSNALVALLFEPKTCTYRSTRWTVEKRTTYYTGEEAVNALARINPSAAPKQALNIISELMGKVKVANSYQEEGETVVSFSNETIAAFAGALTQSDSIKDYFKSPPIEVKQPELVKPTIEELVRQLQTGYVQDKCAAAKELRYRTAEYIQNDLLKTQVTNALVAALSDRGEDCDWAAGWTGGGAIYYYVREDAVKALAEINPAIAAPIALQVIAEITAKPSSSCIAIGGEGVNFVTFSDEIIGKFKEALVNI